MKNGVQIQIFYATYTAFYLLTYTIKINDIIKSI